MNLQKFIGSFSPEKRGFSKPVPFSDAFGFSVLKERKQNGLIFVSIYKFYIRKDVLNNNEDKKPILISVSYAEKLDDGTLRIAPTSIERKINWPIDLLSTDDFFYDFKTEKFYNKKKEISANDILIKIESLHIKPTRLLRGFPLLAKLLFWRVFVAHFFKFLYYLLIKILYFISGTKTKTSIWFVDTTRESPGYDEKVQKESFAKEKINIFGYYASAWSVTAYAILHLGAYSFWYFCTDVKSEFIKNIFSNGFLTITYVIPSLVFFERLVPKFIEYFIRNSGSYFHKASFKQIKV